MFDFMTVAKALTDENRIRILLALRDRELCVCQVTGFLDLAPSTTSKHLSILRQARLIESRKKGKWVYYALADLEAASPVVSGALHWVLTSLQNSSEILADSERIALILQREAALCPDPNSLAEDTYHSLEIHSLEENDPQ